MSRYRTDKGLPIIKTMPESIFKNPHKIRQIIDQRNGGRSPVGVPGFPGMGGGLNMEQVREFIMNQKRCTGFVFQTSFPGETVVRPALPGDARLLIGFAFEVTEVAPANFDLSIDNAKQIVQGSVLLHSAQMCFAGSAKNYVEYFFPLTSKNSVEITYRAAAGFTQAVNLFYI